MKIYTPKTLIFSKMKFASIKITKPAQAINENVRVPSRKKLLSLVSENCLFSQSSARKF
jgi:hypothetical protein